MFDHFTVLQVIWTESRRRAESFSKWSFLEVIRKSSTRKRWGPKLDKKSVPFTVFANRWILCDYSRLRTWVTLRRINLMIMILFNIFYSKSHMYSNHLLYIWPICKYAKKKSKVFYILFRIALLFVVLEASL